jgi:hypothetical protein
MNQDNCAAEGLTYEHCVELMPEWQGLDLKIRVLTGGITNKLTGFNCPTGEITLSASMEQTQNCS